MIAGPTPSRRPTLLLAGAPALAALLYLWVFVIPASEARAPKSSFAGWDLETYFLPKFAFGSEEILNGVLPVWNRYEFTGIPFLATAQPAALYPLKLPVYALLGPERALRALLVLHFALVGALFLLFARSQGIGPVGLAAGTLFVCFNVPFLLLTSHPIGALTFAWVAPVFLLADRFSREPRAASFAGLGGLVALQLTAGYPEAVLDTGLLVALHALVLWALGETVEPPWKTVPLLAAAFVLGGLAAGVQTLPLMELMSVSGRAGFAAEQLEASPDAMGLSASPGVGGLVGFAVAAAFWGERRRALPAAAGALACLFMSLLGWKLLRLVPGLGAIRLPGSWPFLLQFFLAWLAGLGIDGLAREAMARRAPARLAGGLALAWCAVCVLGTVLPGFTAGAPAWLAAAAPAEGSTSLRVVAGGLGAAGSLVLAGVALGPPRLRHRGALISAGVLALVLGQLSSYPFGRPPTRFTVAEKPLRTTTLLGHAVGASRVLSLADSRNGYQMLDRVENVFGREGSLRPPRFTALQRSLGVVVLKQQIHWKTLARSGALLDVLDVGYVLAPAAQQGRLAPAGLQPTRYGHERMRLYQNQERPGRAWAVYGVSVVDSPEAALERVLEPDFDPLREVVLERPPRGAYPKRASRDPTPARVRYPSATSVGVEVVMEASGVLVLADSCFPGWEASVDGEPAELLCANGLVRGVELGAGQHRVRFEYRSAGVRWGLRASVAGIAALCAIPTLAALRRRRGPR